MTKGKEDIREQGFEARRSGKSRAENPHPQGSKSHADWLAGWMLAGMSFADLANAVFDAADAPKS